MCIRWGRTGCLAMTISVTGNNAIQGQGFPKAILAYAGSRGFTLLELVVVLVIIGVVFASAVMVLPLSSVSPVARELRALATWVEYERDQALFDARPRGLGIWYGGLVSFSWYPERGWLPVDHAGGRNVILFESIGVTDLSAAGKAISVSEEVVSSPQVIFSPNGEATPLEARIVGLAGADYSLSIDVFGDVRYSVR